MIMKQGTMNILFFVLKTKLLKNGEAPILMRITINGQYEEIRIQRSVASGKSGQGMQQRKRQGVHRTEQLYFRPHYTRIRKAQGTEL